MTKIVIKNLEQVADLLKRADNTLMDAMDEAEKEDATYDIYDDLVEPSNTLGDIRTEIDDILRRCHKIKASDSKKIKDGSGLLEDIKYKQIYTIYYWVINKRGDKESIAEKVLANDVKEAEDMILDSYEDPENIRFSPYNPMKIESLEDFIQEALEEAHIMR